MGRGRNDSEDYTVEFAQEVLKHTWKKCSAHSLGGGGKKSEETLWKINSHIGHISFYFKSEMLHSWLVILKNEDHTLFGPLCQFLFCWRPLPVHKRHRAFKHNAFMILWMFSLWFMMSALNLHWILEKIVFLFEEKLSVPRPRTQIQLLDWRKSHASTHNKWHFFSAINF